MAAPKPINTKLYEKVKKEGRKKFTKKGEKFKSSIAYSSWITRTYKSRGGKYSGNKSESKLNRWYKEKWVDVCKLPKKVPCQRASGSSLKNYPYCRPSVRVNKQTPKTIHEISKAELKRRCKQKRGSPTKTMKNSPKKSPKKDKTVAELKVELRKKGLAVSGNKAALQRRLKKSSKKSPKKSSKKDKTVAELKVELRKKGLAVSGNKAALQRRLKKG